MIEIDNSAAKKSKTIFLSSDDIESCFDWKTAIESLREEYSSNERVNSYPPRVTARGEGVWLRSLTGVSADGMYMGTKIISAAMHAGYASYLIALFNQKNAELSALLDGNLITGYRTAATTALAADLLAPRNPLKIASIGSGFEAQNHVRALAAIREIESVRVYSPNPASREAFAKNLQDLKIKIVCVDKAEKTLEDANLVLCAARSRDETPTLQGEWLKPGMTILSIGSTMPEQREIDSETVRISSLVIADVVEEVLHDTGDMISAKNDGIEFLSKTHSLSELVSGKILGRKDNSEIVLYKSVGAGLQDLAVSVMCYERAKKAGVGTELVETIVPAKKWK